MTRMATRRSKRITFRHLWDAAWSHTLWVGGQLTLLLVLTALFFTAASSLCDIRRITVSGNHYISDHDLVSTLEYQTENLLVLDTGQLAGQLLQLPWVIEAQVNIRLLHHLQISVTEAEPVALFQNGREWQICSPNGELLPWHSFNRALLLPALELEDHTTLAEACSVIHHIKSCYPRLYAQLRKVTIDEQLQFLVGESEVTAVLGWQELDHQLTKLELFLDRPEMKNGQITRLDLRFQNKLIARRRTDT